jgi:hypothetical protein
MHNQSNHWTVAIDPEEPMDGKQALKYGFYLRILISMFAAKAGKKAASF